ncbi:MAG: winged-helix domain-containing protein [Coriobacteriia bacterium]
MLDSNNVPEASVYRLSLYHCYLGECVRTGDVGRITSRQLSQELGIKEETVRRDMSFVGGVGRPGAGYDTQVLFDSLTEFLGLSSEYPIARIGTAQMLSALDVVFPPHAYGVRPVAYYSELPEDAGKFLDDLKIGHITEIPALDPSLEVTVALVACSPGWVQMTLDMLHEAGVMGVLLLTPAIKLDVPEGMTITHVRMPCDIKSLACRCRAPYTQEGAVRVPTGL